VRSIAASILLLLALAGPASANELTNPFFDGVINPAEYEGGARCDDRVIRDGDVEWHFVHTGTTEADLPADLFLTFTDPNENQKVGGDIINDPLGVVTYVTFTREGVNLISAEDTIIDDGDLTLDYTCFGGPVPEIPETPAAILLPLLAIGLLGRRLLIRRRPA
jgi:hypothetical protein